MTKEEEKVIFLISQALELIDKKTPRLAAALLLQAAEIAYEGWEGIPKRRASD